jgi:putative membrane protein
MNAFSTAAALSVLAATTAAFAAPGSYQYQHSRLGATSEAASCQLKGAAGTGSATSTAFAATAAQNGTVEVALAGLALRKSHDNHVKEIAQRMVEDYAQSNDRLDSIVKCEGLVLPTKLDAKHNATIERLDATSGSAFDKVYLQHIGEKHPKTVAAFESASRSGDPDMAAFAREGLSMLHEHQQLADNLRVAMGPRVASTR